MVNQICQLNSSMLPCQATAPAPLTACEKEAYTAHDSQNGAGLAQEVDVQPRPVDVAAVPPIGGLCKQGVEDLLQRAAQPYAQD
jgi:hypothetical protein